MQLVARKETETFAGVWTSNGMAVILDETTIDFATDFANIVLVSFIELQQAQAAALLELQQKNQLVVTEEK